MEQMNVGQVCYQNWGDETDPNSDWWKLNNTDIICFSHREACEFIVYLGNPREAETQKRILDNFKNKYKMSSDFLDEVETAISLGFNYLCFYA